MKNTPTDPVPLLQDLIRCKSVTPAEGGALTYLENLLSTHGFVCQRLIFRQEGTPDVENLFARIGSGSPHLCFAGHTDVVPEGIVESWTHQPFAADIADGFVYGRGATDMKGSVAAFAAAAIAKASPTIASIHASRFGIAGFTVGFAFIYDPGIMLRGSLFDIVTATLIQISALTLITASYAGYLLRPMGFVLRWTLGLIGLAAAFLHVLPDTQRLILGLGALLAVALWQRLRPASS